jgi:UDP-N-acetylmuramyl tripeptide synthase
MPNNRKPKISIMVDYAHEPQSMERVLDMAFDLKKRQIFDKIIHIISCEGAGRDDWKKPVMGQISYNKVDFSVVSTENYEEHETPAEIMQLITENFNHAHRITSPQEYKLDSKYMEEGDRDNARIRCLEVAMRMQELENQQPLELAEELKILILSTGLGCDQLRVVAGVTEVSDERQVWAELWTIFAGQNNLE